MSSKTSLTKGIPWRVAIYVRLSREDHEKGTESNSITNQKLIITNYVRLHTDMQVVKIYVDDGRTGSNFDRPGFQEMMEDIESGLINCVIVKDFSRFGRDHLEFGRYVETIFPSMGVRFIAINEDYDSMQEHDFTDAFLVPIKNLVNENYCASTSAKTKAHLDVKRKRGDYVINFAPYGYAKDPKNKWHLIIDEEAAKVVRMIFEWRIDGLNANNIANKLNELGFPTPHDFKQSKGCKQHSPFKKGLRCKWHAREVIRILSNETYTGSTVQGKTYKPSFRSNEILQRDPEDWTIVENMHEPIIDRRTYRMVSNLMARDTRTAPGKDKLGLLAGFVFCEECGDTLCRHTNYSKGKKYGYYCCSAYRKNCKACTSHSIRDEELVSIVTDSILSAIQHMLETKDVWAKTSQATAAASKDKLLSDRQRAAEAEMMRCRKMGHRLYDDYSKGLIAKDELIEYKAAYEEQAAECENQMRALEAERNALAESNDANRWASTFEYWRDATKIDRRMLAELVDRITVDNDRNVRIKFLFSDLMLSEAGA